MMKPSLNLSPRSYVQWLRLVFDHSATAEHGEEADEWFWEAEFDVSDPSRFVEHVTRLCREFKSVAGSYTLSQINQGLWFLFGPRVQFGAYLAEVDVALEKRIVCVRAMVHPYSDFVAGSAVEMMENCFDMWWDMLCSDFWSAHRNRIKADEIDAAMASELSTPEDNERFLQVADFLANVSLDEDFDEQLKAHNLSHEELRSPTQDIEITYDELEEAEKTVAGTMLETLSSILKLDDERCQGYALHGLGHLQHPQGRALVQQFIDQHHDEWDEEVLRWVEACRDGTVM